MPDMLTQLLDWRRGENASRGLSKLPLDVYAQTRRYLAETRTTFENELRANPSSRKGEVARQSYQRAHQLARDIVEARIGKVLDLAFQAALGGSRDLPNGLAEDRALFDAVLGSVRSHRASVAPYLEAAGEGPPPAAATGPAPVPAPMMAPHPGPAAPAAAGLPPPVAPASTYVRILKDGRPLAVGRETLEIRKEDILSVGEETAQLLVQAGLAERIRPRAPGATT